MSNKSVDSVLRTLEGRAHSGWGLFVLWAYDHRSKVEKGGSRMTRGTFDV